MSRHGVLDAVRSAWTAVAAPLVGSPLKAAWTAWADGDVPLARELALESAAAGAPLDEARHLQFLTAFAAGRYRDALEHNQAIDPSYRRLAELTEPVIDAYVHLEAVADAAAFARARRGVPAVTIRRLEAHAERPLRITLDGATVVPGADHPLADLLPTFPATINGHGVTVHVDTGGAFLVIGPDRARALGIATTAAGTDRAHLDLRRVEMAWGIADCLAIGGARLEHVPVDVLSTLTGEGDLVIVGTNLLERFLATLDGPGHRLILSRRGDPVAEAAHRAMIPGRAEVVPFHLWGDHFMFARGGFGADRNRNFFVDNGLVFAVPGGGGPRQASFAASKRQLKRLGLGGADRRRGYLESPLPLALGPLTQDRPIVVVGAAGEPSFGGVRVDGLISYGFLKRYVWTIDFDAHEYRFA